MAGNKIGAAKAVAKILSRDPDHFKRIGSKGGKNGNTGGFATKEPCNCSVVVGEHTKPQCAGTIGGKVSKRQKKES